MNKKNLILISLNEVNFEIFSKYKSLKKFKHLKTVIENCITTNSENEYDKLEPWIQWPSIYSGLKADEHKIFRLGDIKENDFDTIFKVLKNLNFSVGAISPMNSTNDIKSSAYFIPDPWTKTAPDKSFWSNKIYTTISYFVKNNSNKSLSINKILWLLIIFANFFKCKNIFLYLKLIFNFKNKWNKALFLDLLLSDIHLNFINKKKPNFTNIFFNGFAHIQHHYFLLSKNLDKKFKIPEWYKKEEDPFEDAMEVYNRILKQHFDLENYDLIVATGLSQEPYDILKFYYRLKNHKNFFKNFQNIKSINELMSRDFILNFQNTPDCDFAEKKINEVILNNKKFFSVDNRGNSLFVTLIYPNEIKKSDTIKLLGSEIKIYDHVSFVAIKNGKHRSIGYYYDSINKKKNITIHITEIKKIITDYFTSKQNVF